MKKIILPLLLCLSIFQIAEAQDTLRLFSKKNQSHQREHNPRTYNQNEIRTLGGHHQSTGFYVGLHSDYSTISGIDALSIGGRVAWVANHSLAIGFAGNGFFTDPQPVPAAVGKDYSYTGGYGGLYIEPILFPRFPVHLAFPTILGLGGIAKGIFYDLNYPYEYTDGYIDQSDVFLIAEPGVELELNAARWIRLAFGFSYRFTEGVNPINFSDNPLDGMTTGFSLKLGKF